MCLCPHKVPPTCDLCLALIEATSTDDFLIVSFYLPNPLFGRSFVHERKEACVDSYAAASCVLEAGFEAIRITRDEKAMQGLVDRLLEEGSSELVLSKKEGGFSAKLILQDGFLAKDGSCFARRASLRLTLPVCAYKSYLLAGLEQLGTSFELADEGVVELDLLSQAGAQGLIGDILRRVFDDLANPHLRDVRFSFSSEKNEVIRFANCEIPCLWLSLMDAFMAGRPGRCEVCKRPFVSIGERGKRRKFCGDACKLYAYRNPQKTRAPKAKELPA